MKYSTHAEADRVISTSLGRRVGCADIGQSSRGIIIAPDDRGVSVAQEIPRDAGPRVRGNLEALDMVAAGIVDSVCSSVSEGHESKATGFLQKIKEKSVSSVCGGEGRVLREKGGGGKRLHIGCCQL